MLRRVLALCSVLGVALSAAPRIGQDGVRNAASSAASSPGSGIAPGSIFVIYGQELGPASLTLSPALPLTTELAGTRVNIGSIQAFVLYTSATQVAAILPSAAPLGPADVVVTYAGASSPGQRINVVAKDFGIFTRNQAGYGPAAVQNFVSDASTPTNGLAAPAAPGQTLILYGTGLGAVSVPDDRAPGAVSPTGTVEVLLGGRSVQPAYAGRSPNFPGLDQINFVVPNDAPSGCYIPVAIRAGNRVSNTGTIAIASTGTCEHPFGLSSALLQKLDSGGTITMAVLSLTRLNLGLAISETADATLAEVNGNGLFVQSAAFGGNSTGLVPGAVGSCQVSSFRPSEQAASVDLPRTQIVRALDAGSSLSLSGPNSKSRAIAKAADGSYRASLASQFGGIVGSLFLEPGRWTIAGAGGTDVAAFSVPLDLPEAIRLTNPTFGIDRSQPFTINWTGGGTGNNVIIGGLAFGAGGVQGTFACVAKSQDRTFTVPASILSQLPAAESGAIGLIATTSDEGTFAKPLNIPLTRGGAIEVGAAVATLMDLGVASFR